MVTAIEDGNDAVAAPKVSPVAKRRPERTKVAIPISTHVFNFIARPLRRLRQRFVYLLPLFVLVAGVGLYVSAPQFLQVFQLKVFDLYQQLRPRPYVPVPVKIIDLDDESLARLGQWPWPRNKLADMLSRLFNAGARVVAFDAVFAERDRTSPDQILPVWLNLPKERFDELPEDARAFSRSVLASIPDNDDVFVDVIKQVGEISEHHGIVAGFASTENTVKVLPQKKFGLVEAGDEPRQFLNARTGSINNLPEIERAASGVGSFDVEPDADFIIRRIPVVLNVQGQIYPSLSAEALRVYQGASTYIIKASGANMETAFGEHTGLNHVKIGALEIPVDSTGQMWLHYTKAEPARSISAWKIFQDDFDPALVEDHILFFGTSAAGLKDLRSTPLNPVMAGVEVHAQATEQILLNHFLARPDWGYGLEITFILALGGILIWLTPKFGALAGASLGIAVLGTAIFGSWYLYTEHRFLLDPLYPSITVVMLYLTSTVISYLDTEAEKRMVRSAFSQYLSPALVERLAQEPERLRLGGEVRNMTFLFCDVRGFTSISEGFKQDPQSLTRLINQFLTPMTDAILARHGTIDKYMGDCIMAFWNAPIDNPQHAENASDSALAMFRELEALNERLSAEAEIDDREFAPLKVGVGLNTGDCVVGNMGSEQRFDYSVLGDAVNLASRLEGQSKNYGVGIVIGEDTHVAAPEFAALELDLIAVKGKEEAVRIYALMGDRAMRDSDDFKRLTEVQSRMLTAYRAQRWDQAEALLADCQDHDDSLAMLYELYAERIAYYRENDPGAKWDGVFIAETK